MTQTLPLRTKQECLGGLARVAQKAHLALMTLPLEEAVQRALRPGGPSPIELRARISDLRRSQGVPVHPEEAR